MAKIDTIDIDVRVRRRPCYVNGKKAFFHQWTTEHRVIEPSLLRGGHCGGQITMPAGIVEIETGEVMLVHPSSIRFVDGGQFDKYLWPDEVSNNEEKLR